MIKINGVSVKSPKVFDVTINDLDGESERNARGDVMRDRIAVKRTMKCEWGPLTQDQISEILAASYDVFFTLEYPDPLLGIATKTVYAGNRTSPVMIKRNGQIMWENLSVTFVER